MTSRVPKQREEVANALAESSDEDLEQLRAYLQAKAAGDLDRPIRTIRTPEKRGDGRPPGKPDKSDT